MSRASTYCSGRSTGPGARHPATGRDPVQPERQAGRRSRRGREPVRPDVQRRAVELVQHGELAAALGRRVVGAVVARRVAVDHRSGLVGAECQRPRVDRAGRDVCVVAGPSREQPRRGLYGDRRVRPGVDDGIPRVRPERLGHGSRVQSVGVPPLRALRRRSTPAGRQGRDLVASGQRLLDERAADVMGASENEQSHAGHRGSPSTATPGFPPRRTRGPRSRHAQGTGRRRGRSLYRPAPRNAALSTDRPPWSVRSVRFHGAPELATVAPVTSRRGRRRGARLNHGRGADQTTPRRGFPRYHDPPTGTRRRLTAPVRPGAGHRRGPPASPCPRHRLRDPCRRRHEQSFTNRATSWRPPSRSSRSLRPRRGCTGVTADAENSAPTPRSRSRPEDVWMSARRP